MSNPKQNVLNYEGLQYFYEKIADNLMPSDLPTQVDANSTGISTINQKLFNTNIAYGTCATAAGTAAKEVVIDGNPNWALTKGSVITVKFTYTNSAAKPTLNVNSTGAYPIYYNNAEYTSAGAYGGYANRHITYQFSGTHWVFISWSYDSISNVAQQNAVITTAGEFPVILGTNTSVNKINGALQKTNTLKYNPNTQILTVPTVKGNLSGVAEKATADGNGNNIINTYATKTDFNSIQESLSKNYVTTTNLTSTLGSYVKNTTLNDYVTSASLTSTLNNYVKNTTLSNYVTTDTLATKINTVNSSLNSVNSSINSIQELLTNKVNTSTLSSYVTNTKLTETLGSYVKTSTLSGYATVANLNNLSNTVSNIIGNVTKDELDTLKELSDALNNDQNFGATVVNRLSSIDTSINSIQENLTKYATNAYLTTTLQSYVTNSNLTNQLKSYATVANLNTTKNDVNKINSNIANINNNINNINTNITGINTNITNINTEINSIKTSLVNKADKSTLNSYVTQSSLTTQLGSYATTETLASYVTSSSLNTKLTGYATVTSLNNLNTSTASNFTNINASLESIGSNITSIKNSLNNKADSSVLSNYVTSTSLTNQLKNYASATELSNVKNNVTSINNSITGINNSITSINTSINSVLTSLSDKVDTSTLNNYVTTTSLTSTLNDYAKKSSLNSYVTSTSLSTTLNDYAKTSTLSSYVTKTTYNTDIASIDNSINSIRTDVSACNDAINNRVTLTVYNSKVNSLSNSINSVRDTLNNKASLSSLNSINSKVNSLQASINLTDNKILNANTNISNLNSRVNTLSTNISAVATSLSDLQNTVNNKQNVINGAASTITTSNLSASKVLISNGSGKVAASSITTAELGHLAGLNTAVQNKFNALDDQITGLQSNLTASKTELTLIDKVNGYTYVLEMANGQLRSSCKIDETQGIACEVMPLMTTGYIEGQLPDLEGLKIIAYCEDGSTKVLEDYTCSPIVNGVSTITYIELGITYTTTISLGTTTAANLLKDFNYTSESGGTEYTLNGWKQTSNGASSTELNVPNNPGVSI